MSVHRAVSRSSRAVTYACARPRFRSTAYERAGARPRFKRKKSEIDAAAVYPFPERVIFFVLNLPIYHTHHTLPLFHFLPNLLSFPQLTCSAGITTVSHRAPAVAAHNTMDYRPFNFRRRPPISRLRSSRRGVYHSHRLHVYIYISYYYITYVFDPSPPDPVSRKNAPPRLSATDPTVKWCMSLDRRTRGRRRRRRNWERAGDDVMGTTAYSRIRLRIRGHV